jgi:hypothetical protein
VHGEGQPLRYPNTFSVERTKGPNRLRIWPAGNHVNLMLALISELKPPFHVLYVLHTPRGGSEPGRYESPELDQGELVGFLRHFAPFFAGDARHDVWVHSMDDDSTVVWDRHDLIYACGPLQRFESVLERSGLRSSGLVQIPDPHAHHYHPEWDASERELVGLFDWRVTPLREPDMQI